MTEEHSIPSEDLANTLHYELWLSKDVNLDLIDNYKKFVETLLPKDSLKFNLKQSSTYLCKGKSKFDQNIEEEWLIVYLLYQLSGYDPDLVIRVYDSDGDILLIEAADHIPRWLESSKSKHRVFIHQQKLHIIPEQVSIQDLLDNPSKATKNELVNVAAQFVRDMNRPEPSQSNKINGYKYCRAFEKINTIASPSIQDAIEDQLSGLPNKDVWLSKKLKQLDDVISGVVDGSEGDTVKRNSSHDFEAEDLGRKIRQSLNLSAVMAMPDEYLNVSSASSLSSSPSSRLDERISRE